MPDEVHWQAASQVKTDSGTPIDEFQQIALGERLLDHLFDADLSCTRDGLWRQFRGNEQRRDAHSFVAQPRGQFQPRHRRHVLIEDQTRGPHHAILEECLCRSIGANGMPCDFDAATSTNQEPLSHFHYRHDDMVMVRRHLRLQGEFNDNTMLPRTGPVVPINEALRGAQ
jgi:hypothetical protein